jgi:putative ABC transport system substrate-binding protein
MRDFKRVITLAALALAAGTLVVPAPAEAKVIGIIYPDCCIGYVEAAKTLRAELSKGGYGDGQAEVYEQKPSSDMMSWANSFRKFVGVDADLIVIFGEEMLETACREKTKIPVLFGFARDPESVKCVKSRENPGGNTTGISDQTPIFTLLDKAKQVTKFQTIGVFALDRDTHSGDIVRQVRGYEEKLGFKTISLSTSNREDLSRILRESPPIDLLLFPDFAANKGDLAELQQVAGERKIPVIALKPPDAADSFLLSMYPNLEEHGALMGKMALDLLQGVSPGQTPVVTPKKVDLVVNVGLARKLGLKLPMSVLNSATKVNK